MDITAILLPPQVDIKAIVHDAGIPEGIGAMSVLNHFYGRDDILLGAYKGDFGKWVGSDYNLLLLLILVVPLLLLLLLLLPITPCPLKARRRLGGGSLCDGPGEELPLPS